MASETLEQIEQRLTKVEQQLAALVSEKPQKGASVPWWERHFGAFKDSPDYDEAMRLGAEYRRAQPTADDECNDDVST